MKDETKCVRRLESDEEDKADGAGDTTRLGEPAQFEPRVVDKTKHNK